MIKLISRIFRKKFPNWKYKRFDQRILSFQIEIFSMVINYRQLKMFITVTRNLNSNFVLCNRLHIYGNRLPAVSECFDSNFKACNRLHTYCNRLPVFRKHSRQSHLFFQKLAMISEFFKEKLEVISFHKHVGFLARQLISFLYLFFSFSMSYFAT